MKKLVISTVVAAGLFTACGNKTEENKHEVATQEVKHEVSKKDMKSSLDSHIKTVESKAQDMKKEAAALKAKADEKAAQMKKEAAALKAKADEKVTQMKKEVLAHKEAVVPAISGQKLFNQCSSCHGMNAEKKALNHSEIIKGWDVSKITAALNGYKDGTYGGAMKGLMKGQVATYDDAKIEAVAKYISTLK